MLLEIWFPQIVIGLGGIGALFCFFMYFSSPEKQADDSQEHHTDH
jgi:hypothetical protein